MEPTDLTIRILQEIRDEQRGMREEQKGIREDLLALRTQLTEQAARSDARFEVIETTLRDLAEQMVMLARGVKAAIEVRSNLERRIDDHERRLSDVEKRLPH
ncbi:MAG: hypothetical protein SFW67_13350 [Myxococcaceae bacterium]|nr:hypothetical protein [Myxococcaceae bacterium]